MESTKKEINKINTINGCTSSLDQVDFEKFQNQNKFKLQNKIRKHTLTISLS